MSDARAPLDEASMRQMPTDELVEAIQDALYDGEADLVVVGVQELLDRGVPATDVLARALVAGMDVVGVDFRDGTLFVPEVLMAAKAMKAGMELLRPILARAGAPHAGTLVIGTVKGDIHDIGKSLVGMMMEGAGFRVVNLGINVDAERFLAAVREHGADILGMSALLTTTMPYMRVVIDALRTRGLRERVVVLVGGAPLTADFAKSIGADAYCRDGAVAVETARALLRARRTGGTIDG